METERIAMSQRERDRLRVLHEIKQKHLTQVEAARRLLLESRLPAKRISQHCGFGSEETMRRSFMRLLAVSPQDYRSRFGS